MSGFSKTFSVTGWRIGYVIADAKWLGRSGTFMICLYVCAPSPFQHGVAAGVEKLGKTFYAGWRWNMRLSARCWWRRCARLRMTPHVPDGAYYILASTAGSRCAGGNGGAEGARAAGEDGSGGGGRIGVLPAGKGEDLLRFCFAKKDEDLAEACRRLRELR